MLFVSARISCINLSVGDSYAEAVLDNEGRPKSLTDIQRIKKRILDIKALEFPAIYHPSSGSSDVRILFWDVLG